MPIDLSASVSGLSSGQNVTLQMVFDGGASVEEESITFGSVASGAWVFTLANATLTV